MHYRRLGRSGIKVSDISLGSWVTFGNQVDEKNSTEIIHEAIDAGINFIDNADIYANGHAEEVLGSAINTVNRESLVLSSKVFWPSMPGPNGRGLSRKHITESIHASLKRMKLDYLDLYFCHRFDSDTPIDEVVITMDSLIRQGKILYWGTCEWKSWQIVSAYAFAAQNHLVGPSVEQTQYNMFHRRRVESELNPICREYGLGLTTWSPLYYGVLTGKYNAGIPEGSRASIESMSWIKDRITPERINIVEQLGVVANSIGITTAQLAISWLLRRKEVSSVITGASKPGQLHENIAAAEAVDKLTDPVLDKIDRILNNYPDEN